MKAELIELADSMSSNIFTSRASIKEAYDEAVIGLDSYGLIIMHTMLNTIANKLREIANAETN